MQAVKHCHRSNNACAVTVMVDGRVDIYARCYGCKTSEYAALAMFDKNRLLPSLDTNYAFRRIVHSPYGIDCVTDTANRKRLLPLFHKTEGFIKQMLETPDNNKNFTKGLAYLSWWSKYVKSASRVWFFVSEPCHAPSLPLAMTWREQQPLSTEETNQSVMQHWIVRPIFFIFILYTSILLHSWTLKTPYCVNKDCVYTHTNEAASENQNRMQGYCLSGTSRRLFVCLCADVLLQCAAGSSGNYACIYMSFNIKWHINT